MPISYNQVIGSISETPCGSWYSTQDQFPTNADTPQAMTVNNQVFARDIVVVDGSKFTVSNTGLYNVQFSAQMYNSDGGGNSAHSHIWLSKNGTAVADTASRISITPNHPYAIPAWNFYIALAVGDYVQLEFEVNTVGIGLEYEAANATPGIPSVIVTINQVG